MKKDKTVKIITFHCVPNYGAILQAYALQKKISEYVETVNILDYKPQNLIEEYKVINTYSYKSVIMSLLSATTYLKKKKNFKRFEKKYLSLSDKSYHKPEEIVDDADFYFLGSDQIWNPEITCGFDKVYFADFDRKKESRAVSYAASLGKGTFSETEIHEFSELLSKLDGISVREDEAKNIIEMKCGKKCEVVLDPTLLLKKEQWEDLVKKQTRKKYVLLYSLNGYVETEVLAEKVARYSDIELVELSGRRKPILKKKHEAIYYAGPEEFLSLIYNADYVVTDSFHGTVFSIIFHRPFLTVPHKTRGGRIKSILNKLELAERSIVGFDKDIFKKRINWDDVDKKLDLEREKSIKFIEQQLGV